jgi:hypothetical protein
LSEFAERMLRQSSPRAWCGSAQYLGRRKEMNLVEFLLFECVTSKYDGSIEIKFEAGVPVLIRKTEILRPEEEYRADAQDQFDDPF